MQSKTYDLDAKILTFPTHIYNFKGKVIGGAKLRYKIREIQA